MQRRRLALRRETIRALTADDMRLAHGGYITIEGGGRGSAGRPDTLMPYACGLGSIETCSAPCLPPIGPYPEPPMSVLVCP